MQYIVPIKGSYFACFYSLLDEATFLSDESPFISSKILPPFFTCSLPRLDLQMINIQYGKQWSKSSSISPQLAVHPKTIFPTLVIRAYLGASPWRRSLPYRVRYSLRTALPTLIGIGRAAPLTLFAPSRQLARAYLLFGHYLLKASTQQTSCQ